MSPSGSLGRLARVPTGVLGLDTILDGGFFEAGLVIVQGPPGSGKTILGNQLCFNHARMGGRALYVTLLAETHTRMLLHLHSMDYFDPARIPDGVYYISAFPALEAEGLPGLMRLLWAEVRGRQASLLVLDGLVSIEQEAGSPMAFKRFVHELQTQATVAGCGVVLLTDSHGEIVPTAVEHTIVDAVIEMRSRLYGWRAQRDLEVVKRRGDTFLRGRHAFRITGSGIQVYPRFEAMLTTPSEDVTPAAARLSTGLPELDDMFGGGIPEGSTTMVTGLAGVGKTALGLHFLGGCGEGEQGVIFSASESPAALRSKAAALGLQTAALLDRGHIGVAWSPGDSGMLDEICGALLAEIDRRGARRLVMDGVAGLVRLAPDPDRIPYVFAALRHGMRARGVTTLFTTEHADPGAPPPGLPDLSGITDNIVSMRLLERRSALVRLIQVRKARNAAIDTRMRTFEIGPRGIQVAPSHDWADAALDPGPWPRHAGT